MDPKESHKKVNEEPDFEAALKSLEVSVQKLESGQLSLEDSLKAFEEGIRFTRICQKRLSEAEKRIELLTQVNQNGKAETQAFEVDSEHTS